MVPREVRKQDQSTAFDSKLGVWDTVSLIIGIVIGAGIFETAPLIFSTVKDPSTAILVWIIGGALSLIGALCYAELASTYPKSGGDYVYLTRAYGRTTGFLFGWAQLSVILTGSIGMMAFIFADYATSLWGFHSSWSALIAAGSVLILSLINVFGLKAGKRTQNILSLAKLLGLALILIAGLIAAFDGSRPNLQIHSPAVVAEEGAFGLALVFVLYTFGGWNDAAFVAAEMRDPRRGIVRALILGTGAITLIYLLINGAYLVGLGIEGAGNSNAIAADLLKWPFGDFGSAVMAVLVMVSALSAVNGLILTGSRVYLAVGADHALFSWLAKWHPKLKTPIWSIATQALISVGLIFIVSTSIGRGLVSALLQRVGLSSPNWVGHGGFETLLKCTAPVFWLFFLLTGLSVFVLRKRDPKRVRSFEVPLYPLTPLVFCATCVWMLYRSAAYAGSLTLVGFALLASGCPLYWLSKRRRARSTDVFSASKTILATRPSLDYQLEEPT